MAISTHSSTNRARLKSAVASLLVLFALPAIPLSPEGTARADNGQGIFRWDPLEEQLVPVPQDEIKPGCVYSHFSKCLNQRVWSYVQADGQFWYALGPGTTLEGRRLDVRDLNPNRMALLEEKNPQLAADLALGRTVTVPYFALACDDTWYYVSTAKHPTIYNLETGQRWDRVYLKCCEPGNTWKRGPAAFLPVVHTWGYRWTVQDGKYVPDLCDGGCACSLTCAGNSAPSASTCDCDR